MVIITDPNAVAIAMRVGSPSPIHPAIVEVPLVALSAASMIRICTSASRWSTGPAGSTSAGIAAPTIALG
jgi:uncharacterized membrane protein